MRAVLLILVAITIGVAVCGALATGCSADQKRLAHFGVSNAFDVLSLAYSAEAAKLMASECKAYPCPSVEECPAADQCPALVAQEQRWRPIWGTYDALATATELGQSDEAGRLYCSLVAVAPAPLPKGPDCK